MTVDSLRTRMLRGDILSGTFVKTLTHNIVEIMALSGLEGRLLNHWQSCRNKADFKVTPFALHRKPGYGFHRVAM